MGAAKKSVVVLSCLLLAVLSLLSIITIITGSSARASQAEVPQPVINLQPAIVISPTMLEAMQYPDGLLTQTLWITNTGDNPLTYTIYEMSASIGLAGFSLQPASNPKIDPQAQSQVASQNEAQVIIYLRELPDLSPAYNIPDKTARAQYVYNRLLETASHSQELFDWLESHGAQPQRLLTANAIAAETNASQLVSISANPQVMRIVASHSYQIIPAISNPVFPVMPPSNLTTQPETVEWNITKIGADQAWSTFNITGTGAVVGIVDTGVSYLHPALVNSYRGNLGENVFDHNYSWYDFVNGQPVPYDPVGHGTWGAGIISGDDGGGNQIGVAPGADWIAVRACDYGCTDVDLLAALQWMLAPTDLNGESPQPSKAPDVVLGMWGGGGCDDFFQPSLSILRAAGILPVFSPGASGPSCASMGSPADLPEALAAGATDNNDHIASFSSRGPATCNPGEVKPDLSAPGVSIRTSNTGGGYTTTSGTSWSAAHTAGAAALVISADPSLGPDRVEDILYTTALCIDDSSCTGGPCPLPNNVYGHGRIDAFEAVSATINTPPAYDLPWLSEAPIRGTLAAGASVAVQVTFDATGLSTGVYTGALGIASSDPITPFISVPVTLNVIEPPIGPIIGYDPPSFSAALPISGNQTETLTIRNDGDAILTFTLYEVTATLNLLSPVKSIALPNPHTSSRVSVQVDAAVRTQLLFMGKVRLILYLRGQPDLSAAYAILDRVTRVQYVYDRLLEAAAQNNDLYNWLESQGAEPRRLLTANAIAATLDEAQLETVLGFPQVGRLGINGYGYVLTEPLGRGTTSSIREDNRAPTNGHIFLPLTVEWNIAKIRADEVWSTFGIRGEGPVIGIVDSGVMYDHPALVNSYRGNLGGGTFNHNYNWFDFFDGQPAPYDDINHGTFGAGIAVGDDGIGNQIGVAPGAQWIAYKALDNGGGNAESLHAGLQWMLAPTDLLGANPNPKLAPQVLLNMWRWNSCDHSFDQDLVALRAANILPVFAAGGEGPECGLVAYPGASPDALSAGATDINDVISGFSAKGPSCVDGGIKPDLAAPGVNIRSSTSDGGYQSGWSGTSFSTAHLAGAAALLFSANPHLSLDELEQTLFATAVCRDDALYCGGDACPGANNAYGYGRIDVFEAVSQTMSTNPPYDIPWLIAGPLVGVLQPGGSMNVPVIFYATVVPPGVYHAGIGIESNDPLALYTILPVTLTVVAPCQGITDLITDHTPITPTVGELVTFTASASGTLPITYTWEFDDGSSALGEVVTHVFDSQGIHVLTLTVENTCDLVTDEINVPVEAVIQRFLLPLVQR